MIRQIEKIAFLDFCNSQEWRLVPLVPGSATLTETTKPEENKGNVEEIEISAVIKQYVSEMTRDLVVFVEFDDRTSMTIGTEDLPATFELKRTDSVVATLKYERIPRR